VQCNAVVLGLDDPVDKAVMDQIKNLDTQKELLKLKREEIKNAFAKPNARPLRGKQTRDDDDQNSSDLVGKSRKKQKLPQLSITKAPMCDLHTPCKIVVSLSPMIRGASGVSEQLSSIAENILQFIFSLFIVTTWESLCCFGFVCMNMDGHIIMLLYFNSLPGECGAHSSTVQNDDTNQQSRAASKGNYGIRNYIRWSQSVLGSGMHPRGSATLAHARKVCR
jgi:hypothetical protein